MSVESLQEIIPEAAKDLRLNLSSVIRQAELSEQQTWGTVLACVFAVRAPLLKEHLLPEARENLSPQAAAAAESVAGIMGMNNIFYRFRHLAGNEKYATLPARLRMNALRSQGIEQKDIELWSLAVSAITGCGACVESHEKTLREHGISEETIVAAVRIASVLNGLAYAL